MSGPEIVLSLTNSARLRRLLFVLLGVAGVAVTAGPSFAHQFTPSLRWQNTATDGPGINQGDPITLTWGFVPDGTVASGASPLSISNSELIATLDAGFNVAAGAGSDYTTRPWFEYFDRAFNRWGEVSGVTYVYEPNDDGVPWFGSAGVLGVRADLRIGGGFVDGVNNVLAFNPFPNQIGGGDMGIDTSDIGLLTDSSRDYRAFRNLVTHEHGHGLSLAHVESSNSIQMMEPSLQTSRDGPQFDDILGAHRGYGDFYEKANGGLGNDTIGNAVSLGLIDDGMTRELGTNANNSTVSAAEIDFVSIDDNSDTDFFSFTVDSAADVDIVLTPSGPTYFEASQCLPGNCPAQTSYATSMFADLDLALFDSDQSTMLASDDSGGLGQSDTISFTLDSPGDYYVRIGSSTNDVQMYMLDISVSELMNTIDGDFDGDGDYDCDDVDALVGDIAAMNNTAGFDLNGDGSVNRDDLDAWLVEAGATNLPSGNPYLDGDANLDGAVDVSDLNRWSSAKFTQTAAWCDGDFNADGVVDVSDLNIWNSFKFQSSDVAAVPEPTSLGMLAIGVFVFWRRRR